MKQDETLRRSSDELLADDREMVAMYLVCLGTSCARVMAGLLA